MARRVLKKNIVSRKVAIPVGINQFSSYQRVLHHPKQQACRSKGVFVFLRNGSIAIAKCLCCENGGNIDTGTDHIGK